MQAVADGMSLTAIDANGDGIVGSDNFLAGTVGDGIITLNDIAM